VNKEIAYKWAAALRSGKYQQGRGKLRVPIVHYDKTVEYSYCCLGVLCDLYDSTKWDDENYYRTDADDALNTSPPYEVCAWAGINHDASNTIDKLINLNDDQRLNFDEIAAYIEEHADEL
jgi:hypothetical protein